MIAPSSMLPSALGIAMAEEVALRDGLDKSHDDALLHSNAAALDLAPEEHCHLKLRGWGQGW